MLTLHLIKINVIQCKPLSHTSEWTVTIPTHGTR